MADQYLLLRRGRCKRKPESLVKKVWIVTESIRPMRLIDDPARHLASKGLHDAPLLRHRNRAAVPRRPITHAAQFFNQQPVVVLIARSLAGKPGRPHTR